MAAVKMIHLILFFYVRQLRKRNKPCASSNSLMSTVFVSNVGVPGTSLNQLNPYGMDDTKMRLSYKTDYSAC